MSCARVLVLLLACAGCVKPLATPPLASHAGVPVEVPYPPPAARVDIVKDPPEGLEDAVWIDGQWVFRGRRWTWEPGEWTELPKGSGYAPPKVVRRSDGTLVWFEGAFRPLDDGKNDAP